MLIDVAGYQIFLQRKNRKKCGFKKLITLSKGETRYGRLNLKSASDTIRTPPLELRVKCIV